MGIDKEKVKLYNRERKNNINSSGQGDAVRFADSRPTVIVNDTLVRELQYCS